MGGKSTLLRSTCIAVVMAQIGCYVAGSSAVLAPVDAIFTRIGGHAAAHAATARKLATVGLRDSRLCLGAWLKGPG
jgi:hypothetical protein